MLGMPSTKAVLQELPIYSQINYFLLQMAKVAELLSPATRRLSLLFVD
jgi:hypothetical protein